jgi:hypothetical protein
MATDRTRVHHIAFERLDAKPFRVLAFLAPMSLAGINKFLGGSWWAFPIAFAIVFAGAIALPSRFPKSGWRRELLLALCRARTWPWRMQIVAAVFVLAGTVALDYYWSGASLGRSFNLFLMPIIVSGLLFGLTISLAVWLVSIPIVLFCVIPPEYSLNISDLKDVAILCVYSYQGLFALVVPVGLWGSCEISPA